MWRKISDDPPPRYTSVLIYVVYTNERQVQPKIHLGWLDGDGDWHVLNWTRIYADVTHWMPLPEPPGK
jgi:hypothetical protein